MTSARLISTTERYAQPGSERALVAGEPRRVEAAEAIAGDRKRSLREELNEAESDVGGQARENAHRVAAQLAELPPEAQALLAKPLPPNGFCVVDEQA
ncbi:hypothetical protein [Azonexus sp.]|jgi:hypothetical protein|uniref:hypothetical protein n=1 Tax=Azonexus sp. TaxID=1872668 RepID=UPI0028335BC3|nr:hypothetical protein [Azonexus sp.]MDR1995788.1 hypothetical protein [Azonexus sp.]